MPHCLVPPKPMAALAKLIFTFPPILQFLSLFSFINNPLILSLSKSIFSYFTSTFSPSFIIFPWYTERPFLFHSTISAIPSPVKSIKFLLLYPLPSPLVPLKPVVTDTLFTFIPPPPPPFTL